MRRSRERQSRERQSRERKNRERPGGKKYFLVPAVLLCAAVAILYGKSVLAEEKTGEHGMEQTDPAEPAETQVEIVCPAPDGNNGWYRSSPEPSGRRARIFLPSICWRRLPERKYMENWGGSRRNPGRRKRRKKRIWYIL